MKKIISVTFILCVLLAPFAKSDDVDYFTPEFYLHIKASSKVSLTKIDKDHVAMNYFVYDPNTSALIKQPQFIIDVKYLNDQKADLNLRISHIDELLADIAALP